MYKLKACLIGLTLATCVGCQHAMLAAIGLLVDHSTVHLVYNARATLQFSLGDKQITAIRYARITYRTGFDGQYGHACYGPGVTDCTYEITNDYFIGLPDGNIAHVHLKNSTIDGRLSRIAVGETGRGAGLVSSVLSDKFPHDPDADKLDSGCHRIINNVRDKLYGTPTSEYSGYPANIAFERLPNDAAVGKIDNLDYFFHGPPCADLIKGASRDVVVATRPQPTPL